MPDIKELNDDKLASVVGGIGGDTVDCKYPVGTKFIIVTSKNAELQLFDEVTNVEEVGGIIIYYLVGYGIYGTIKAYVNRGEIFSISETLLDMEIEQGTIEIYNG